MENETLAGRIDGVALFVLHMAAAMHRTEALDGGELIKLTREFSKKRTSDAREEMQASSLVLAQMAERLEDALRSTGHLA
jgi:hypothetical protein